MRLNGHSMLKSVFPACVIVILALLLSSCGGEKTLRKEGPYWHDDDRRNIEKPASRNPALAWESIDRTFWDQAEQAVDIERNIGKLFGSSKQAVNINSFDEVPSSSWFTNRHGLGRMSPKEIRTGRTVTSGPDTTGPWLVFRPKVGGATAGFWIEDIRGDQYILKFDPPHNPELATSAAAMGSRYFHACGYNVPQETIVHWSPEILRVKEGVTVKGPDGVKRPFTMDDLQAIIATVPREPDGRIRSLASMALQNVRGPFSYDGTRKDDPNDVYPHEHRRELRGLYVIASLVNHYDTKDLNTLDAFEEEDGRHFLRHYLIDFGSTFGSDGQAAKHPRKGYANVFDLRDVLVSLFTLGLKSWSWQDAKPYVYSSVGYFESEIFEPNKFDPIVPNPAFENMTDRDAYWGAKIVMAFRDDDLKALVEAGQLSNPMAEGYLLNTLIERRDKIGRHWFSKVNPLDRFDLRHDGESINIDFEDLAVKYGLEPASGARYQFDVKYDGKQLIEERETETMVIGLSSSDVEQMTSAWQPSDKENQVENHLYEINIRTSRNDRKWSKPTRLWLWYDNVDGNFTLVGIEHVD